MLSKVGDLVLQGWLDTSDPLLLPYQRCKYELNTLDGCVLLGNRVVVPPLGRAKVMADLHDGHPGIHMSYETIDLMLCMVAKHGPGVGANSQDLQ